MQTGGSCLWRCVWEAMFTLPPLTVWQSRSMPDVPNAMPLSAHA